MTGCGEPDRPSQHAIGRVLEGREVRRRRLDEALAAGLTIDDARAFRDSGVDVGELRRLVQAGCPPELIARILL